MDVCSTKTVESGREWLLDFWGLLTIALLDLDPISKWRKNLQQRNYILCLMGLWADFHKDRTFLISLHVPDFSAGGAASFKQAAAIYCQEDPTQRQVASLISTMLTLSFPLDWTIPSSQFKLNSSGSNNRAMSSQFHFMTILPRPVSYTHLTLPTKA